MYTYTSCEKLKRGVFFLEAALDEAEDEYISHPPPQAPAAHGHDLTRVARKHCGEVQRHRRSADHAHNS